MIKPNLKILDVLKNQLYFNPDKSGNNTECVASSENELSSAEKETKLNQIMNDLQRGSITVDKAKAALEELGIVPEVVTEGKKTIFRFEFKGKKYTINYVATLADKYMSSENNSIKNDQLARINELLAQQNIIEEQNKNFAVKSEAHNFNYETPFEIEGSTYTLNDILSSDYMENVICFDSNSIKYGKDYVHEYIEKALSGISDILKNVEPETKENTVRTLVEYYYEFVTSSFVDSETFQHDQQITVHNYVTDEDKDMTFNIGVADYYGIKSQFGEIVEIDIKKLVEIFMEIAESAL